MNGEPNITPASERLEFLSRELDYGLMLQLAEGLPTQLETAYAEFGELAICSTLPYHKVTVDPKTYFAGRILREMLEASMSLCRWITALKSWQTSPSILVQDAFLSSMSKEQSALLRRMFEVSLICGLFELPYDPVIFDHFLLLQDLSHAANEKADLKTFLEIDSKVQQYNFDAISSRISVLEANNSHLKLAWYLPKGYKFQKAQNNRKYLTSTRSVYLKALPKFSESKKAVFGMTYSQLFGDSSQKIHFTPSTEITTVKPLELSVNMSRITVLAMYALEQLAALMNLPHKRASQYISKFELSDPSNYMGRFVFSNMRVDDFVLLGNSIPAQIVTTHETKFGYQICKLDYIDEPPKEPYENWYPPACLFPYFSIEDQEKYLRTARELITNLLQEKYPELSSLRSEEEYESKIVKNRIIRLVISREVVKMSIRYQRENNTSVESQRKDNITIRC